ncbi:MAG TPA: hypothetical protein PKW37_07865 [Salinivirgaceae bacterium]|nr:hypothetical protein [Salinivirgaceae bacterium]
MRTTHIFGLKQNRKIKEFYNSCFNVGFALKGRLIYLISFIFILSIATSVEVKAQCDNSLKREAYKSIESGTYLRDFRISLPGGRAKNPPTDEKNIILNKGSRYRFSVASDPILEAMPVIRIYDSSTEYITVDNGTMSVYFDFECKKTQVYNVSVSFKNGRDGCCILMLGLMSSK